MVDGRWGERCALSAYGTNNYTYDEKSQLKSASNPEGDADYLTEVFDYDELGNRINDQKGAYRYDAKKARLLEDYKYLYSYDNNGNLTSRQEKGFTGNLTNYTYSSENQLVKIEEFISSNLVKRSEYSYDALGRRMRKEVTDLQNAANSKTRKYVYDGDEILAEYDDNNSALGVYTHSTLRTDDVLAVDIKSTKLANQTGSYFYLKDALGSITDIVDSNGSLKSHYVYSSFGKILKISDGAGNDVTANPPVKTSYSFTGREYDSESGMYYYRARYYMPEIGRFISVDPDAGSTPNPSTVVNKYTYAGNNPIVNVDPNGQFFFTLSAAVLGTAIFGRGEAQKYAQDLVFAAAAVGIIIASGGTAAGAISAVGSAAGGAAVAAAASTVISGGNFNDNFHSFFRVSLLFLVGSAITAPGGISSVGGNGLQGYVISNKPYFGEATGLTIGSASTYSKGSGFAAHEFSHTLQFIGIGALNKDPKNTWYTYLGVGALGGSARAAGLPDSYNPIEFVH